MQLTGFKAKGDIVGRRARICWEFAPGGSETLADIPHVHLRRKRRDFAFPDRPKDRPDPYQVYDSKSFPPAPIPGELTVTDLPSWEVTKKNGERTLFEPISVAVSSNGRFVEILRRTIGTIYSADGLPVRQTVEILDVGTEPGALLANAVYYYQVFGDDLPPIGNDAAPYRGSAMVTDGYGLNRTLYESLPEIYRRHDVTARPETPGFDSVPELSPGPTKSSGQLRRFLDPFGLALDSMRGTAEGLRTLHDVDGVDASYLDSLAHWIGWDLSVDTEIPVRRNELKAARRLYGLVGTLPGLRALVTQHTGWSTQIAEFAQNIAQSNAPPQRHLFAITRDRDGTGWVGAHDPAEPSSLVSLESAPGGRLSPATDAQGRIRLFYEAWETPTPADIRSLSAGGSAGAAAGGYVLRRVHYKTFADGAWRDSHPILTAGVVPQADPAAIALADDRIWLGWLEHPQTGACRLRFMTGTAHASEPARLFGQRREPFKLTDGAVLTLVGNWEGADRFTVHETDFADPARASADELVRAINNQLAQSAAAANRSVHAKAGRERDGSLRFESTLAGASATIAIDLKASNTARALGFDQRTASGSPGSWNEEIRWTPPRDAVSIRPGYRAELAAVAHPPGGVRVAWAGHSAGQWRIQTAHWSEQVLVGTANGLLLSTNGTAWVSVGGLPSSDVRAVAVDADGIAWIATANGVAMRRPDGGTTTLGSALPSSDIRHVAFAGDGTVWFATAGGIAGRAVDGTIAAITTQDGLPTNDVRAIAVSDDGTLWAATAAGAVERRPSGPVASIAVTAQGSGYVNPTVTIVGAAGSDAIATATVTAGRITAITVVAGGIGYAEPVQVIIADSAGSGAGATAAIARIRVIDAAGGLPSPSVRDVAIDAGGTVYLGTAAGLAIKPAYGDALEIVNARNGLGSDDVRCVKLTQDGVPWVATARGVSTRSANGEWTTLDTSFGLASNDVLTLSFAADGRVWAGTAAGVSTIAADHTIRTLTLVEGAANAAARSIHTGWSATRELGSGGGSNREPTLASDEAKRTWLIWSQQTSIGGESWTLRCRIFDPTTMSWGPDTPLTVPAGGGRSADRIASAAQQPGGMRIYFASNRNGGSSLWSVDVTLAGAVAPPVLIIDHASSDLAPTPVEIGDATWLVYRSDRNIPMAQAGSSRPGSERASDNGTLRRHAGTVSIDRSDLERMRTRRTFGDLLSYTPNRPDGVGRLSDGELYTRGTIGLYVSAGKDGSALTQQEAERLREVLARFTPGNLRTQIILVPSDDTELVYGAGTEIDERYQDVYPFAEALGAISDESSAVIPGLTIVTSNRVDHVSANPADSRTLRQRTFFPPLK